MFPNAPNKKAPPAPIKRRGRCGKCNWLPFYRPYSFAPRAFARFAGCIRDIAQCILNFFFFFSQYRERKFGENTKKKERGGQKTLNAASPSGLDNLQKIHYTTNRKGAVSCKRLAPYLRIKELTARLGEAMRRSFLLSIFILPLCNFPCDIKSTEQDRKDQAQQADDDR